MGYELGGDHETHLVGMISHLSICSAARLIQKQSFLMLCISSIPPGRDTNLVMHATKTHAWWVSGTCFRDIFYVRHKQPPSRLTPVTFNKGNQLHLLRWPFLWFLNSGIDWSRVNADFLLLVREEKKGKRRKKRKKSKIRKGRKGRKRGKRGKEEKDEGRWIVRVL